MEGFRVRSKIGDHVLRDGKGVHMPVRPVGFFWTEFANRPAAVEKENEYDVEAVAKVSAATERSIRQAEEDLEMAKTLRKSGSEDFRRLNLKTIVDYIRDNRERAQKMVAVAEFHDPDLAKLGKSQSRKDTQTVEIGKKDGGKK